MTFDKALEEFELLIGKSVDRQLAQWFYMKGQVDMQKERLKVLNESK